jgi:hypothetical protein
LSKQMQIRYMRYTAEPETEKFEQSSRNQRWHWKGTMRNSRAECTSSS